MRPVKPATMSAPNRRALSISISQPRSVCAVELLLLQRIAEHAERADLDVGVADRFLELAREARNVLVAEGLPEERLDALEAERQDCAHIGRGIGLHRP